MKLKKLTKTMLLSAAPIGIVAMIVTSHHQRENPRTIVECGIHWPGKSCVMKTIFGFEKLDTNSFVMPAAVKASLKKALDWIDKAQNDDGGWGAGTHFNQGVMDPHAVKADPATTSLVAMALLRTDNSLEKGSYNTDLKKATEFLLKAVENCPASQPYITTLENTQPQVKLGRNIDVILTAQYFTNLLRYEQNNLPMKKRIEKALDKCIARIQNTQDADGGWKQGGWAPVLQSALANNALETAKEIGRNVNSAVLNKSRRYQNGNFDTETNQAVTGKAAGVLLYSLSSTTRASAQDARKAKDLVNKAKKKGKLNDDKITEQNLKQAGASPTEAKELYAAYQINEASRREALKSDVMAGFGSNGGEEFLSYLMTGESMRMQSDNDWLKWYDMITSKLVNIQNQDGSWNGHHCITSPVFCTATCLLILSIHNDVDFSIKTHQ
jgi:Squalene-hopene cyclase C-terminal domain/Prenyltransferase and squalene oxidase repeat